MDEHVASFGTVPRPRSGCSWPARRCRSRWLASAGR